MFHIMYETISLPPQVIRRRERLGMHLPIKNTTAPYNLKVFIREIALPHSLCFTRFTKPRTITQFNRKSEFGYYKINNRSLPPALIVTILQIGNGRVLHVLLLLRQEVVGDRIERVRAQLVVTKHYLTMRGELQCAKGCREHTLYNLPLACQ